MDLPTIGNIAPETLALLGFWLFTAIQFAKGKLWPDKWTALMSIVLPFALAAVVQFGNEMATQYVQLVAVLFLLATGTWAINKAGRGDSQ